MAESVEKGADATTEVVTDVGSTNGYKAIILGATGATGRYLVGEILSCKSFAQITLLGRRKLTDLPETFEIDLQKEEESGHLVQETIDCDEANEENSLKYFQGKDVFFSCFGTTRSAAGGNENFKKIDYGHNVKFAEIAKKAGIRFYSLMSSSGAHPRSFVFYLKVKGQIEEAVTKLEFPLLTIFRPGMLDRLQSPRLLERVAGLFVTKISVAIVAKAMLNDALIQLKKGEDEHPHSHILSNHQILDLVKVAKKKAETPEASVESKPDVDKETAPAQDAEKPSEEPAVKETESKPEPATEEGSGESAPAQASEQEQAGKDEEDQAPKS